MSSKDVRNDLTRFTDEVFAAQSKNDAASCKQDKAVIVEMARQLRFQPDDVLIAMANSLAVFERRGVNELSEKEIIEDIVNLISRANWSKEEIIGFFKKQGAVMKD